MSDKFFDKDNNFILWKDKGDLTEASKYLGDNRGSIGIGESLATKIAKGKVEIDRTYGWVDKPLTVNWGKCGGNTDVIVTYNSGDALWIPNAFLAQGTNGTSNQPKPDALYLADGVTKDTSVGYKTWFGVRDCDGVTERQPCDSNSNYLYIAVYKLPQELGEWLYENAENNLGEHRDYSSDVTTHASYNSSYNYKGIAIYPESVSNWSLSANWGVGIRKKEDIPYIGMYEGEPTYYHLYGKTNSDNYSAIFNLEQWKALEDDAYYLVAQERGDLRENDAWLSGQLSLFNIDDTGSDHIWLRRYNTMTQKPHWSEGATSWTSETDDSTNVGAKYIVPQEMCQQYGITQSTLTEKKDSLTVNWGKCGGTEDVVVTYNRDEGIWIPKGFITNGATSFTAPPTEPSVYPEVGYCTWFGNNDYGDREERTTNPTLWINVCRLPQELGKYLYENAETLKTDEYLYDPETSVNFRLYKGIATYPDNSKGWEYSLRPYEWGGGVRTKQDLLQLTSTGDGITGSTVRGDKDYACCYNYTQYKNLADGYYFVFEQSSSWENRFTQWDISDEGINPNHIYLRYFKDLEGYPSATNKGRKYTLADFDEHPTLPTPNEDQVVIDWGGGIKTYYKYGEPMYVPRAFLMEGFDSTGYPMPNRVVTGSGYVGFADSDSATGSCLSVYKLPQELGEYLYDRAESTPTTGRYGSTSDPSFRIYKGIAVYSDTLVSGKDWNDSDGWGIGIRKKSDLNVAGHNSDGTLYNYSLYTYTAVKEFMDDSSYYLVTQSTKNLSTTTTSFTYQWLQCFPKDEPVWMRSFKDMTSKPSATNMGKKMVYHPEHGKSALGGKIFYIDSSDNGATYTFFDEDFNEINNWSTISDLANAKYYSVKGTPSKDKFYVYYPTKFDSLKWWDNTTTTTGATGSAIGTGKTNTATIMARTDIPTGSIWSKLSEIRTSSGISDLFIPSMDEIDKFRVADLEPWHRSSGGSYLWSSSEYSAPYAWYWNYNTQTWNRPDKNYYFSVFFARAF